MLGVIGISGVMSYIVSQRSREIGVRLALGTDPGHVAAMIARQGGFVAIAGVIVGLGLAPGWLSSAFSVCPLPCAKYGTGLD